MAKFNSTFAMFSGLLAVATLAGCMTDASDGSDFSFQKDIEVVAILPPSGTEAGVITTREVEYDCDEDNRLVSDTVETEMNYLVSAGTLRTWEEGDCLVTKLSGSSTTIIGTWTGTSLNATDSIPAAYRPDACDQDFDQLQEEDIFEGVSLRYKISEDKIQSRVSGRICFAPTMAAVYEDNETFEVTSSGCSSVKVKNVETKKTATLSSHYGNDSAVVNFSYGKSKCSYSSYIGLSNKAPMCTESATADFEQYSDCILESGFYGEDMAKAGALLARKSVHALRNPRRGVF